MYTLKSLLLLSILIILLCVSIRKILFCISSHKKGSFKPKSAVIAAILLFATILATAISWDYLYPYNRELKPELVGVVETPEDVPVYGTPWNAVYEQYGIYAGSWLHPHEQFFAVSESDIPEFDLENYTYIITYGQKIKSLSYNVWHVIDVPSYTGEKVGYMVLEDIVERNTIYVYRIPKMRINNDE